MNTLIERYVYDVARRLPEKDREEVKKELRANIYDMLPDGATDEDIKKVLYELGSPVSLAEKYRTKPRYLISPAYYDEYVGVLKWVLPLVGVIVMVIGFAVAAFEAAKTGSANFAFAASNIFSRGVSMGVTAAFQALVWTTIGFVIAEHSGEKKLKPGEHGWRVEDLPEVVNDKARISLSEGIAELILLVVFTVFGLLFCTGRLPFAMMFSEGGFVFFNIFSQSFLMMLIPAILVSLVLGLIQAVAKIKDRRWSAFVCVSVVAKQLVGMAIALYMLNQPQILSAEFRGFLDNAGVTNLVPMVNGTSVIIILLSVFIIIGSIAESIKAVVNTVKYRNK